MIIQQNVARKLFQRDVLFFFLEVCDNQESLGLGLAVIGHEVVLLFVNRNQLTIHKGFLVSRIFAEGDHFLIIPEQGMVIRKLCFCVDAGIVWIYRQPGGACGKAGIGGVFPLKRCAGIVRL